MTAEQKETAAPPQKEVIDQLFKPDATFTLSQREFAILEQIVKSFYQPFEWANSVLKTVKQATAMNSGTVPTYKEDYELDKSGNFVLNDVGLPSLKEGFWERYQEKENAKKSIILSPQTN